MWRNRGSGEQLATIEPSAPRFMEDDFQGAYKTEIARVLPHLSPEDVLGRLADPLLPLPAIAQQDTSRIFTRQIDRYLAKQSELTGVNLLADRQHGGATYPPFVREARGILHTHLEKTVIAPLLTREVRGRALALNDEDFDAFRKLLEHFQPVGSPRHTAAIADGLRRAYDGEKQKDDGRWVPGRKPSARERNRLAESFAAIGRQDDRIFTDRSGLGPIEGSLAEFKEREYARRKQLIKNNPSLAVAEEHKPMIVALGHSVRTSSRVVDPTTLPGKVVQQLGQRTQIGARQVAEIVQDVDYGAAGRRAGAFGVAAAIGGGLFFNGAPKASADTLTPQQVAAQSFQESTPDTNGGDLALFGIDPSTSSGTGVDTSIGTDPTQSADALPALNLFLDISGNALPQANGHVAISGDGGSPLHPIQPKPEKITPVQQAPEVADPLEGITRAQAIEGAQKMINLGGVWENRGKGLVTLLKHKDVTVLGAVGYVGNGIIEAPGLNPRLKQYSCHVDGCGVGIFQLDNVIRWPAFVHWAKANNRDPYTVEAQFDYAYIESTNGSQGENVITKLQGAKNPRDAAYIVGADFERPKHHTHHDLYDGARGDAAVTVYNQLLSLMGINSKPDKTQPNTQSSTSTAQTPNNPNQGSTSTNTDPTTPGGVGSIALSTFGIDLSGGTGAVGVEGTPTFGDDTTTTTTTSKLTLPPRDASAAAKAIEDAAPPVSSLINGKAAVQAEKAEHHNKSGTLSGNELEVLGPQWGHARMASAPAQSFRLLAAAFKAQFGHDLQISGTYDAYRPYSVQVKLKAEKPTLAATPGTSEHGWGFAVDMASHMSDPNSAESKWMHGNAGRFGWYHPSWAEPSGSMPEPWHWEFRGSGPVISGKTPAYLK